MFRGRKERATYVLPGGFLEDVANTVTDLLWEINMSESVASLGRWRKGGRRFIDRFKY
jgi:hypothetical protein